MAEFSFFENNQWQVVDVLHTAERPARLEPVDDLELTETVKHFLHGAVPSGMYSHQKMALRESLSGKPVCIATGTASGKSLVFQTAALDLLARNPKARVMAIYPMKALGNEQRERWDAAVAASGLPVQVGRVDGNVPPAMRVSILERSQIVVFTPDILHAWLLSNLNQPAVIQFLSQTALMVVDEVHAYNGVFGSNAAYLFRRLRHLMELLRAKPRFICASATIADPQRHLAELFGLDFSLVGPQEDSSPRHALEVKLVSPPEGGRTLDSVVSLLNALATESEARFIAFVDSRKQVELLSSILARVQKDNAKVEAEEGEEEAEARAVSGLLSELNVLPYRAGYEEHDRTLIQGRLSDGTLRGVISTSALELGLDIPHLDTCVLIGVPSSSTSLQQRIGRIGRHAPGTVIVVNGGDVTDRAVFANPPSFFTRPMAESALYLENRFIQYIHALCLARVNGEHSQVMHALRLVDRDFVTPIRWPGHFVELCRAERAGQTPRDLIGLKNESKDRPNYAFPLREVESQFKVEKIQGPTPIALGSLSFGQLMREAYPGAIYYYAAQPYRVTRVNLKTRLIQVRREKRYTTRPNRMQDRVFPRLNESGVFSMLRQGHLINLESQVLVRESINGVTEQRGGNESQYPYPLPRELGFYQDQPYFNRNYFTTGVVMTHPALGGEGVYPPAIAELVYEAFLLLVPFDRQDIGFSADVIRQNRPPFLLEGMSFLVIFDQIYGSLRLTARLLEPGLLGRVLLEASLLAAMQGGPALNAPGRTALAEMTAEALVIGSRSLKFETVEASVPEDVEKVILPGSKGLLLRSSEEFRVLRIGLMPNGLAYEGVPTSLEGSGASTMPGLADVAEIPGESKMGIFDPATGDVTPLPEAVLGLAEEAGEQVVPVHANLLAAALATYLDGPHLTYLAAQLGMPGLDVQDRQMAADQLVSHCLNVGKLGDLPRAIATL
ncbi:MAG: DEAD/DEAH box helicase [Anaerolineae bacterium]|nr:DEAD/DEAH box helicase [Anaerolineae bacterium]